MTRKLKFISIGLIGIICLCGYWLYVRKSTPTVEELVSETKTSDVKIFLLGIDGATFKVIEPLIAAGNGTVIEDVLTLFGLKNIASETTVSYPRYSIEEIIYQDPDIIFIGRGHANIRLASEKFLDKISVVSAVRKGKVFFLSDRLYRLSPRIIQGIEEMAACLK